LLIDDPIAPLVFFEQRRRQPVITKAAAALPVDGLRNAARVCAVNYFFQARNDVRVTVFAEFDHDPAAAHFMGNCAGGAGTGE
jgi:hypothetical protein